MKKYHIWVIEKEHGEHGEIEEGWASLFNTFDELEDIKINVDVFKNCFIRITYEEQKSGG